MIVTALHDIYDTVHVDTRTLILYRPNAFLRRSRTPDDLAELSLFSLHNCGLQFGENTQTGVLCSSGKLEALVVCSAMANCLTLAMHHRDSRRDEKRDFACSINNGD